MIHLSAEALSNLWDLIDHYERLARPEAARNLQTCLGRAIERMQADRGPFFPAPRPYKAAARQGWLWLKEGPYWFAFRCAADSIEIRAIFHESANIPGRV